MGKNLKKKCCGKFRKKGKFCSRCPVKARLQAVESDKKVKLKESDKRKKKLAKKKKKLKKRDNKDGNRSLKPVR